MNAFLSLYMTTATIDNTQADAHDTSQPYARTLAFCMRCRFHLVPVRSLAAAISICITAAGVRRLHHVLFYCETNDTQAPQTICG